VCSPLLLLKDFLSQLLLVEQVEIALSCLVILHVFLLQVRDFLAGLDVLHHCSPSLCHQLVSCLLLLFKPLVHFFEVETQSSLVGTGSLLFRNTGFLCLRDSLLQVVGLID
jgi:hypothetical protein